MVFSFIFGGIMGENTYKELLMALNATDFGMADPLFGRDVGYYMFIRPFLQHAVGALRSVFLLQTVLVALVYVAVFFATGMRSIRDMVRTKTGAVSHVLTNMLLFYIGMLIVRKEIFITTYKKC